MESILRAKLIALALSNIRRYDTEVLGEAFRRFAF